MWLVGVESETASKHITEAAVNYVKEWNLLELIDIMHFDTINTNTGKLIEACKKITGYNFPNNLGLF